MSQTSLDSPETPEPDESGAPDQTEGLPARGEPEAPSELAELAARLSPEEFADFVKLVARIPEDTPVELVAMAARSITYSGPVPPPAMMREYEDILPGSADRFLKLVENEQSIRRRDNGFFLRNDRVRVVGSVVVSLALVGGAVYCAVIDQPAVAIALGVSGAVPGVVRHFMKDTR